MKWFRHKIIQVSTSHTIIWDVTSSLLEDKTKLTEEIEINPHPNQLILSTACGR